MVSLVNNITFSHTFRGGIKIIIIKNGVLVRDQSNFFMLNGNETSCSKYSRLLNTWLDGSCSFYFQGNLYCNGKYGIQYHSLCHAKVVPLLM